MISSLLILWVSIILGAFLPLISPKFFLSSCALGFLVMSLLLGRFVVSWDFGKLFVYELQSFIFSGFHSFWRFFAFNFPPKFSKNIRDQYMDKKWQKNAIIKKSRNLRDLEKFLIYFIIRKKLKKGENVYDKKKKSILITIIKIKYFK